MSRLLSDEELAEAFRRLGDRMHGRVRPSTITPTTTTPPKSMSFEDIKPQIDYCINWYKKIDSKSKGDVYPIVRFARSYTDKLNSVVCASSYNVYKLLKDVVLENNSQVYKTSCYEDAKEKVEAVEPMPIGRDAKKLICDNPGVLVRDFFIACLVALLAWIIVNLGSRHSSNSNEIVVGCISVFVGTLGWLLCCHLSEIFYIKRYTKYTKEEESIIERRNMILRKREGLKRQRIDNNVNNELDNKVMYYTDIYFSSLLILSSPFVDVHNGPRKGRSEDILFKRLMDLQPSMKWTVKTDVAVKTDYNIYFPDITLVDYKGVCYDIEIDEPYTTDDKRKTILTHYIGGRDDERNRDLTDSNWFVIRFSEKQVMTDLDSCIQCILGVFLIYDRGGICLPEVSEEFKQNRWTKEEARYMAIEKYRSKY